MSQLFKTRRQRLLSEMDSDSIAIIPAAPEVIRNGDALYPYRQNSDFYYLTGFTEPEAVLVLLRSRATGQSILFNRPRNPEKERWTGRRLGQADACDILGVDEAYDSQEIDRILPALLENRERIYYPIGYLDTFDTRIREWVAKVREKIRLGVNAPEDFVSTDHVLHEMRLRKSEEEIQFMRQAAEISAKAHCAAMKACKPYLYEYELEAVILQALYQGGCRSVAYDSIVGGGANACILHYTDNSAKLKSGDLVLVDAGGEYKYYAADITRTYPVSGRFSDPQRQLYQLVLTAQLAGIAQVKPGNRWCDIQETIVEYLIDGLIDLKLLSGDRETLMAEKAYRQFYMHGSGHWLGMDVHDVGTYKVQDAWRPLEPGMVLTVEPGLYIDEQTQGIDPKWKNIGIRIEDDILVTQEGYEILSKNAPKEIDDIERLMQT